MKAAGQENPAKRISLSQLRVEKTNVEGYKDRELKGKKPAHLMMMTDPIRYAESIFPKTNISLGHFPSTTGLKKNCLASHFIFEKRISSHSSALNHKKMWIIVDGKFKLRLYLCAKTGCQK